MDARPRTGAPACSEVDSSGGRARGERKGDERLGVGGSWGQSGVTTMIRVRKEVAGAAKRPGADGAAGGLLTRAGLVTRERGCKRKKKPWRSELEEEEGVFRPVVFQRPIGRVTRERRGCTIGPARDRSRDNLLRSMCDLKLIISSSRLLFHWQVLFVHAGELGRVCELNGDDVEPAAVDARGFAPRAVVVRGGLLQPRADIRHVAAEDAPVDGHPHLGRRRCLPLDHHEPRAERPSSSRSAAKAPTTDLNVGNHRHGIMDGSRVQDLEIHRHRRLQNKNGPSS